MDQTEFQQLVLHKLEKECPNTIVTYLGEYEGLLAYSIDVQLAPGARYAITGFPVYALVEPGDFERYRLVSDMDFKITDHFFPARQDIDYPVKDELLDLHLES